MSENRWSRRTLLAAAGAALIPARGAEAGSPWRLWYQDPASRWIDALPVGNGRLGTMVYGGVSTEVIHLNEDSLWAGRAYPQDGRRFREGLPQVRALLLAGQYQEANALAGKTLTGEWGKWFGAHQTLGDLVVETGHAGAADYSRELNLEEGAARVVRNGSGRCSHRARGRRWWRGLRERRRSGCGCRSGGGSAGWRRGGKGSGGGGKRRRAGCGGRRGRR